MAIKKVKTNQGETKWEVILYVNGRGSKRVRRRFERKRDAEDFVDDFKAKAKDAERIGFSGNVMEERCFEEEAEYWLNANCYHFSESHKKRVRGVLNEILPIFGKKAVVKFTPGFLVKFQNQQLKVGKTPSTVNRKTEVITAILNNSFKHRRIPYNPSAGFTKLKSKSAEMGFWEKHEAIDFLRCMNELHPKGSATRWRYVVYLLALNTGMRAGEIWGLMPKDFSKDGHSIYVVRQYNYVAKAFGPTKGKNHRHVPLNDTLKEELLDLIKQDEVGYDEPVFKSKEGPAKNHDSFIHRFLEDMKKWGGRQIRFHDLRHTATTLMLAGGTDLKTVKEVCGHRDISTTMNYVHLLGESVAKLSRSFNLNPFTEDEDAKEVIPFKRKV
jgi:integrase